MNAPRRTLEQARELLRLLGPNLDHYTTFEETHVDPETGKHKGKYAAVRAPLTAERVLQHLNGEGPSLLVFPILQDNTCNFGVCDVDAYGGTLDPGAFATKAQGTLTSPPMVTFESKSGGLQNWIFLAADQQPPVQAKRLRAYLTPIAVTRFGVDPGIHVDTFPAQDTIEKMGNGVNLFFYGDKRAAFRPDGTRMAFEEFLSQLGTWKANSFIPVEEPEAPKGGTKGKGTSTEPKGRPKLNERFNRMKKDLAKHYRGHPYKTLEEMLSQADLYCAECDPPPTARERREWDIPSYVRWLMTQQEARNSEKSATETKDVIINKTADAVRALTNLAYDAAAHLHIYDASLGRYVYDEDQEVRSILLEKLVGNGRPMAIRKADVEAVLLNLYSKKPLLARFPSFPPIDEINVKNGLVNVTTLARRDHSPDFLHPNQFDIEFDPNATCPEFDSFLERALYPGESQVVFEFLGFFLVPDVRTFQKALLLFGDGGNGKSTLLAVIADLLGEDNISAVTLHELETDRFAPVGLVSRLLNIEADLTSTTIPGSGTFKKIVGGDAIEVQQKYEPRKKVRLYSRMLITANEYPQSRDTTPAFWDRWIVLPVNKINFRDPVACAAAGIKWVPQNELLEKLHAERPGILVKALRAYRAAKERGAFYENARMSAALLDFKRQIDPLSRWLDDQTMTGDQMRIRQMELHAKYNEYCRVRELSPLNSRQFSEKVLFFRPGVTSAPYGKKGDAHFHGIAFREVTGLQEPPGTAPDRNQTTLFDSATHQ